MSKSLGFEPLHKDDAVALLEGCSDRFGELAALFGAIAFRIGEHDDLHKLATLGRDAANDYANMADCGREQLEKGGFRQ